MKTREILIIAAVAAAAYFLYKRMQKGKQPESKNTSEENTPERPTTATPPIVPTFEQVNPEDFERQAFEIVRN